MSLKDESGAPPGAPRTVHVAATPTGYECRVIWPSPLAEAEIASHNPAPNASAPAVPAGTHSEVVLVR